MVVMVMVMISILMIRMSMRMLTRRTMIFFSGASSRLQCGGRFARDTLPRGMVVGLGCKNHIGMYVFHIPIHQLASPALGLK